MNLRFTHNILAMVLLAVSDTALAKSARRALQASSTRGAINRLSHRYHNNVMITTGTLRRAGRVTTSIFEQGVSRTHNNFNYPDVGILQQGKVQRQQYGVRTMMSAGDKRYLQAEDPPLCGTNGTCAPSMCNAIGSRLTAYTAAIEFNAICTGYTDKNGKNWTFEGCVNEYYKDIPGHLEYVKDMYCRIAKCSIEGGTYGACYCQLYHDACLINGDKRPLNSYSQPGNCEIDACCQNTTDETGMMSCLDGYPGRNKYRQENPRCGTNGTCHTSFCDAYVGSLGMVDRALQVNDICNGVTDANGKKWGIEGCIRDYPGYPNYQLYYKTFNCDLAKCFVDGGTEVSCYCQMFQKLCEQFGDAGTYGYEPSEVCTIDACCQSKSTVAGKVACLESEFVSPPSQNSPPASAGDISDATTGITATSSARSTNLLSSTGGVTSLIATAGVWLSI